MSWAMTAISAAISAYSINEKNKAAAQQQANINSTAQMNYMLEQQKQQEIQAQAGMELSSEAIKRNKERGAIRAAQGESGVAGISPLRELANSYMQQSFDTGTLVSKERAQIVSSGFQNLMTYQQAVSDINQLEASKTEGLAALAQISMSAAGSYFMAGGTIGAGGGTLTSASGATATMSTAEVAAMGSVPSGYTFAATPAFGSKALGAGLWSLKL